MIISYLIIIDYHNKNKYKYKMFLKYRNEIYFTFIINEL